MYSNTIFDYLQKIDPTNTEKCKLPRCKEAAGIYKVIILVVGFIFLYNIILILTCESTKDIVSKDPLNRILFKIPFFNCNFSGWPLTHFICFFVLGLLFPDEDLFIIGGGIIWELFESTCFLFTGRTEHTKIGTDNNVEYTSWWNGSIQDVVFNTLGFYAGKLIVKISGKKICFPWVNDYTEWCGGCDNIFNINNEDSDANHVSFDDLQKTDRDIKTASEDKYEINATDEVKTSSVASPENINIETTINYLNN